MLSPIFAEFITLDQMIQFLACKSQNTEREESYILFFHFLTEVVLQLLACENMTDAEF